MTSISEAASMASIFLDCRATSVYFLVHMLAGSHIIILVFTCVELLHASGKLPLSWQLVRLTEELDICQHDHCCVCVTAAVCINVVSAATSSHRHWSVVLVVV